MNQTASSADRNQSAESTEVLGGIAASPLPADLAPGAEASSSQADGDPAAARSRPQLVKQANLAIVLPDPEAAVEQILPIMTQAQGSLLDLQDHRSPEGVAHQISLTLRVPQNRLDSVLADIRALGTVQSQSITAEDVSDQIVDLEARLKKPA